MPNSINKVGLAVVREGELLLVRKRGTNSFLMPGGKVEGSDKNDIDALKREIQEELGCKLLNDGLKYCGIFEDVASNDPGKTGAIKLYRGEISGEILPQSEIEQFLWFNLDDSSDRRLSPIVVNYIMPFLRREK